MYLQDREKHDEIDQLLTGNNVGIVAQTTMLFYYSTDLGPNKYQVNLCFVISPGAKLHGAVLIVKREVGDVHGTGRFENSWRNPGDGTIKLQKSFGLVLHKKITYSAACDVCMCV